MMKNILFCLPLLAVSPVFAEPSDETQTEKLPVIVINSGRMEIPEQLTPGDYQVIEGDEIRARGVSDVAEALTGISGLQIQDFFGDRSRVSVSMRGFGGNMAGNTLILVDGIRLNNNVDIAAPNLNSISLQDVDRIEVLHGSGGVLFGGNAVGGVINIVTRRQQGRHLGIHVSQGSYDAASYGAHATTPLTPDLQLSASGENLQTDNYRRNNHLDRDAYRLRLDWRPDAAHLFASFSRTNENLRFPGALSLQQVQQNRRQAQNFQDFANSDADRVQLGARLDFADHTRFEIDYDWRDDDVQGALSGGTSFTQTRRQWSYRPRILHKLAPLGRETTLVAGIDYERAQYELVSPFGVQSAAQRMMSRYVLVNTAITPDLVAHFGLRYIDADTDFADPPFGAFANGVDLDDSNWVRDAGIRYQASEHLQLFVRRSDSFRLPTVDEHSGQPFGVTTPLKPQDGVSWEGGLEVSRGSHSAQLAAYRLRLENEIAFDSTAPGIFNGGNTNLDPTTRKGVRVSWAYRFDEHWQLQLGHETIDARFSEGQHAGNRIPFVARYNSDASLQWKIAAGHNAVFEFRRVSDRRADSDDQNIHDEINGHEVVNFGYNFRYRSASLGLRVNNVLNERYDSYGVVDFTPTTTYYPAPERNFMLRLEYRLGDH